MARVLDVGIVDDEAALADLADLDDLEAAHAGATLGDVDELLRSGDTWVV